MAGEIVARYTPVYGLNELTRISGYATSAVRPAVSEVEIHERTVSPFALRKESMSLVAARGGK
jgi:hypothetical protein